MNPPVSGIVGDAFDADVRDERAELDGLRVAARVSVVPGDVGEQDRLPVALLDHDELAVADVGQAFGIVELGALRAAARRERHRVDQLPGLVTWTIDVPPSPTMNSVSVSQL